MKTRFAVPAALLATLLAAALVSPSAMAQNYPNKPLRLIVPFPPGGPTDIVGRMVGQKLADGLGQPVVVENRPGAGGTVGSEAAAKSAPDGYTLLYGSTSTLGIAPSLYPKLGYDAIKSFAPISLVSSGPLLVVVNPAVPAKTLKELIALAKAKPGQLNYGSAGNGTPLHLAGELFKTLAGVDLVHIPYKGGAPAITDTVAGQVQIVFEGLPATAQFIRAGKLRALAITGTKRDPTLPDVPTVAEAGLPQFQVAFWSGLVAPAGTPKDIVARLNAEVVKALATPEVRETLAKQGLEPSGNSPEQFAAFIGEENARWARVVKVSGAKLD